MVHFGFDRLGSFSDLARSAPLDDPIKVTAWRTAATDIPTDPNDRIAWLDEQWLRVDQWIHEQSTNAHPRAATSQPARHHRNHRAPSSHRQEARSGLEQLDRVARRVIQDDL